ncbi:MAG TPA: multicopper oxidase [Planctomycetota bacterium]|jgi:FtsP/CotA-like multicopper oxidase with cupredoxin domain|nr:multicopper oxidase [Planctomycetota bacterium]
MSNRVRHRMAGILSILAIAEGGALGQPILDPGVIPKYVEPLVIPPVMAPHSRNPNVTRYRIAVRQFDQQVLPAGFPMTTVWGYGRDGDPLPAPGVASSFNFPAFTVEARRDEVVRVRWINGLVDANGGFLPHLLPVDQTLHWANPPGPPDSEGTDPTPYVGPVPIVTHLHGAHVPAVSDGFPEAWYLPAANDVPPEFATAGSHYGTVQPCPAGTAVFEYPNDQRATTLWYHDHALGLTRANVYAGLAGFWLLRDDVEDGLDLPGPAPSLGDPPGTRYFEIPIAIQDRTFRTDGSLFYPDSRAFFDGGDYSGPYFPATDIPPIWNPEFFGNAIVVNGRTWPFLEVEPRLYRFRFLNGCNARFLILKFDGNLPFHQIGSEGGLLPGAPVLLAQLLMAPAERADVIVDFSPFAPGDTVVLRNLGPDSPFGVLPVPPGEVADPATTGQVMQFRIVPPTAAGNPGQIPASLPAIQPLGPPDEIRDLTLNELESAFADIPTKALLGTGTAGPLRWEDAITERPVLGATETWRLINLTEDAHPIHLHLVQFQVLDRQRIKQKKYVHAQNAWLGGFASQPPAIDDFLLGSPSPPESWETGWKDTVVVPPGAVTRIAARFDRAGLYVWHCHILEHEDNEMMRAYEVVPP